MLGFSFVSYNLFSQIDSTKTSFLLDKSIENAVLIDNSSLGNMIFVEKNRKNVNSKILIYHNNKFYQFDNYIDSLKLKENIKFNSKKILWPKSITDHHITHLAFLG